MPSQLNLHSIPLFPFTIIVLDLVFGFITKSAHNPLVEVFKSTDLLIMGLFILTEEEICNINCALQIAINTLTILLGNSYIKVREINDKKLFARHKGGTLTPETSLNRDTEEERKIMDSVVNDKK